MVLFAAVCIVLLIVGAYALRLRYALMVAPQVDWDLSVDDPSLPSITVVIPAYNEAENVRDCLLAVLDSSTLEPKRMQVILVDDQSTDATLAIAQSLQQERHDLRLQIIAGQPRPIGEVWAGKNWACVQGAQQATGEYLLFVDADVRLQRGAIAAALRYATQHQVDLLSCGPNVICGCFSEWLVQPLILSVIMVGFRFDLVNDPASDTAFAAGPFMLFRRESYTAIGGHRAVAGQVVEDVELARLVKRKGLRLEYVLGIPLATVQMYQNWAALWEGWTKNLYMGSQRNFFRMMLFIVVVFGVCTLPWLLLMVAMLNLAIEPHTLLGLITLMLAIATVGLHYSIRRANFNAFGMPTRYWWLTGLGGLAVAAIALGSVIKTETGWGWTWRGRSLQLPQDSPD